MQPNRKGNWAMPKVTIIRTGSAVAIQPTKEALVYFGAKWPVAHGAPWSMGPHAFEQMRRENPDVEFEEKESK